jgi:hypothetical protein
VFDASPRYVRAANRYLVADSRLYNTGTPRFMYRPDAVTAARVVRAPQMPAPSPVPAPQQYPPPRAFRYYE